jgi:hypothetical protein
MIDFPLYRKFSDNKTFYKIHSPKNFLEIKLMGKYYFKNEIEAKRFPEILLIDDMIKLEVGAWIAIDESEFEEYYSFIEKNYELRIW